MNDRRTGPHGRFAWAMVAVMGVLVGAAPLYGGNYFWTNGAEGNWTNAANWGGTVPVDGDSAWIRNGTCWVDTVISPPNNLALADVAGNLTRYEIRNGAVATNDTMPVTVALTDGTSTGTVVQTGGTVKVGTHTLNPNGLYELQEGRLDTFGANQDLRINGGGTFVQSGGTSKWTNVRIGYAGAAGGNALYEISGGRLEQTWQFIIANDPAVPSTLHIIGSGATIVTSGNGNPRLIMNGANAELKVTLDGSGVSPIDVDEGNGKLASISNAVLTVNSELHEITPADVPIILADEILGWFSQTNFTGTIASADVVLENGDVKLKNIRFVPRGTVIAIH